MNIPDILAECMDLDQQVLTGEPDSKLIEKLADAHRRLADVLENTDESEVQKLHASDEVKKQILSEKHILPVLGSKSEYDAVTLLTTFSCFMLSQRNGEKMHSGKYMNSVKRIHELVNAYYGKDPESAKGCS